MAHDSSRNETIIPLPSGETDAERRRIRASNDRDQRLEREGKVSPHNVGYDQAADGESAPAVVVDQDND